MLTQASLYDTPLSLCAAHHDHGSEGDPVHCGKILLKSGADPTFTDDHSDPRVIVAIAHSPVSIHICVHATYCSLELLTMADNF